MKGFYFFIAICNLFYSLNVFALEKVNVFVSILPQKYFVERVGGDLVQVNVMVGPGQNPATYEPTPKQMTQIAKAKLYFSIDVPFERAWLTTIGENNKDMLVIDCCGDKLRTPDTLHHHDPHVWTSPLKVINLIKLIEENLSIVDSVNASTFSNNAKAFMDELSSLDNEIRIKTEKLVNRDLIVSHPSWSYFAEEYGFLQIPVEQNGKEIQANSLSKLIKEAKQKKIKAVFIQPQFNNKAAEMIARELKAELIMLDPLAYDYMANMRQVMDGIIKGLSNE